MSDLALFGAEGWLDVTWPVSNGMVHWPGQTPTKIERISNIDNGDGANVTMLQMSVHTGTHVDAPVHFLRDGADITSIPLDALLGMVRVAEVEGGLITPQSIDAYCERRGQLQPGERVLFRTANSQNNWFFKPFKTDYVAVSAEAAEQLVLAGVSVVGVDYLSVAPFANTTATHMILLGAGVWVIEGLDLRSIAEGDYQMLALSLKITGSDGSPLRVLLRPASKGG